MSRSFPARREHVVGCQARCGDVRWVDFAVRLVASCGTLALMSLTCGCRCDDPTRAPDAQAALSRGDTVVVERSAAEFFQARVLALEGEKLRVQTAEEGDPITVAASDAYRLPSGQPVALSSGDFAICNDRATRWVPCRMSELDGDRLRLLAVSGKSLVLPSSRVLRAGGVTRLNIEQTFNDARQRTRFLRAALRAGEPPLPANYTPHAADRVLARQGDGWFSARVQEATADGGVLVQWEGEPGGARVELDDLALPPPHRHQFIPGQFALEEPPTLGQPWIAVKVKEVGAEGVLVENDAGESHRVSPRALVPLRLDPIESDSEDAGS